MPFSDSDRRPIPMHRSAPDPVLIADIRALRRAGLADLAQALEGAVDTLRSIRRRLDWGDDDPDHLARIARAAPRRWDRRPDPPPPAGPV